MLLRFLSLTILLILLNGCTTSLLQLPPQDNIKKLAIENNQIQAESDRYGYLFNLARNENDYLNYVQFINQYKNYVEGTYIVFNVTDGYVQAEVTAQYNLIINTTIMDNQQIEDLKAHFRVINIKNGTNKNNDSNKNNVAVQFQAQGIFVEFDDKSIYRSNRYQWERLDDKYRLQTPIPVMINDNTKTLSDASAVVIVPLFPLIMLYGCTTSHCI